MVKIYWITKCMTTCYFFFTSLLKKRGKNEVAKTYLTTFFKGFNQFSPISYSYVIKLTFTQIYLNLLQQTVKNIFQT